MKTSHASAQRSLFLVIEGVDGAGKGVQVKLLQRYLRSLGRQVLALREPGGTRLGGKIRRMVKNPAYKNMTTETELFLFLAARAQIVREVILPALASGMDILCDRYTLSTLVYQALLGGLPLKEVKSMCDFATGPTKPDLCLVLDLPVAESLARRKKRGGAPDRIEHKHRRNLARMRSGYRTLGRHTGYRCQIVNASRTPEAVHATIRQALQPLLASAKPRQAKTPRRPRA